MNKLMSKFFTIDSEPICTQTKIMHRNFSVSNNILPKFSENSSYKSKKCLTYFWCFFNQRYNFDISEKKGNIFTFSFEMQNKSSGGSFLLQRPVRQDYFGLSFLNIWFVFNLFVLFFNLIFFPPFLFLFYFSYSYFFKLFRSFVYILETCNAVKFRWVNILTFFLWNVDNYLRKRQEGN